MCEQSILSYSLKVLGVTYILCFASVEVMIHITRLLSDQHFK